jgi:predicted TIM-barrel fold metal-dependent hydrolase
MIDVDLHVFEPADLWLRALPRPLHDRAPRGIGATEVLLAGLRLPAVPWRPAVADLAETSAPLPVSDYHARLDVSGCSAAVLCPTRGLYVLDPALVTATEAWWFADAWTEWARCTYGGDERLIVPMLLPLGHPHAAVSALEAGLGRGARVALARTGGRGDLALDDPAYHRLWSMLAEARVPLLLHDALGTGGMQQGQRGALLVRHAAVHPFEAMLAVAELTLGGVFTAHPELRVLVLEAGCGWLPWWLAHLDEHAAGPFSDVPLAERPTLQAWRQLGVAVDGSGAGARACERAGMDGMLVLGSDWPHADAAAIEAGQLPWPQLEANAERLLGKPTP